MKYKTKLILYLFGIALCVIGLVYSVNLLIHIEADPCYSIPQCTVVTHTYNGTTITKWVNP